MRPLTNSSTSRLRCAGKASPAQLGRPGTLPEVALRVPFRQTRLLACSIPKLALADSLPKLHVQCLLRCWCAAWKARVSGTSLRPGGAGVARTEARFRPPSDRLRRVAWLRRTCALACAFASSPQVAVCAEPADQATASPSRKGSLRTRVEVAVLGDLSSSDRTTLRSLLASELAGDGLQLFESDPPVDAFDVSKPLPDNGALMRAVLDVRSASSWRVWIVDVARARQLLRRQVGPEVDAAALEATASILGAAAGALHEGFELGSDLATPIVGPVEPVARAVPEAAAPLRVFSAVGASLSSFAKQAPVQLGPSAALGVRVRGDWMFRLQAAHVFAQRFDSRFGAFNVDRSQFGLAGGVVLAQPSWEGELAVGMLLELLRRRGAAPTSGVAAAADSSLQRAGGELRAALRYLPLRHLSLEVSLGAAYFPSRTRFTAAVASDRVLLEPYKLVGIGGLALQVLAP